MRRVLYLFLPNWPIDRRRSARVQQASPGAAPAEEAPFAMVAETAGRRLLAALNPAAAAAGLAPGMPLADALSFLPGLATAPAQPTADHAALTRLAEWCRRYSPWTAPDGADAVTIEIAGSAHLWGGEIGLAADLTGRLARQGLTHRIAVADTLGAAAAMARFAAAAEGVPAILRSEATREALAPLPVEALRLNAATVQGLRRVGLRRLGELYPMPRDALARRFGDSVARRLDQALGALPEPLSPLGEAPVRRIRLSFAEPIADPADLARAIERLAGDLVPRLARERTGARRLDLAFHRVDGRVEHIRIGTARPSRDPHHLAELLAARLETVDPGLGVEDMILAAFAVEKLPPEQIGFAGSGACEDDAGGLAPLLDRLGARLGLASLSRLEARESHLPERASHRVGVSENSEPSWPGLTRPSTSCNRHRKKGVDARDKPGHDPSGSVQALKPPRPVRLFEPPQPVEASWLLPDDPPFHFTWRRRRHRITQADGPERIAEEWWTADDSANADASLSPPFSPGAIRDYYRVEDEEGRRFWLFRAGLAGHGDPPRWFLHGLFA
ncbi:MAG: DNA polymerase Y family protein [Alphaproteobacteria bacterium]|nr:DNA polymerase Y family protein [Alphaproteobacteria bacterium]